MNATAQQHLSRRSLVGGTFGGLLGGICCIVGAVAVGAGLAGTNFATDLMGRFQGYALAFSAVFMVAWIVWLVRGHRRVHLRGVLRHLAVMAGAYAVTLGLAYAAVMLPRA